MSLWMHPFFLKLVFQNRLTVLPYPFGPCYLATGRTTQTTCGTTAGQLLFFQLLKRPYRLDNFVEVI